MRNGQLQKKNNSFDFICYFYDYYILNAAQ